MSKKKATQQPSVDNTRALSDNTRKLIIIIAIVLVAVIILSVALALILNNDVKTPANNTVDNSNSSTLPVKNGDFLYVSSTDTGYPRNAVNWTKYGYQAPTGSSQGFDTITSNEKSVMGVIDVSDEYWSEVVADLEAEGVTNLQQIQVHSEELEDSNVYMIANKEAAAASILSDSVSVSSGASVRVTVRLYTAQITDGNAVIMIQKSSTSALSDDWYAYRFDIAKSEGDTDKNGWQEFEFYIFNRESTTKYVKVGVGLGDVYGNRLATGVLFIDDITYETVTANDYREQVDDHSKDITDDFKPFQIIENEDIKDESEYNDLEAADDTNTEFTTFEKSSDYVDEAGYSPFTDRDDFFKDGEEPTGFKIYKATQGDGVTALRLKTNIELKYSQVSKDHYHISFWVRVEQENGHAATQANVYVQKLIDGEWEDLDNGSFTKITTSQDLENDNNCGWVKYDVYLKPASSSIEEADEISILFVLGKVNGYNDSDVKNGMVPNGSLYVTSPASETISSKDYSNASSGTYVKKLDLTGSSASTSVTNGSFSNVNAIGNEPTGWTPVFAGDNALYRDGLENTTLTAEQRSASSVAGSGVYKLDTAVDDSQRYALKVVADGTSFGYLSSDITLAARTVYMFSVLVKGSNPFIYLVDNSKDRADAIVARVEKSYSNATAQQTLDSYFDYSLGDVAGEENVEGWTRYYVIYVTGDSSETVRIALFNGKIDPAEGEIATGKSEICYDSVKMRSIGTYSFVEGEDEDAENYLVQFSATSGYDDALKDLIGKDLKKEYNDIWNAESEIVTALGADNKIVKPDEDTWKEMSTIPEDTDGDDTSSDDSTTTTTTTSEVDLGLLFSVISSVLLVAALLIVLVVKLFQRKRTRVA